MSDLQTSTLVRRPELFGNRTRTSILTSLRLLGTTYARELAQLLGFSLFSVQRVLKALEREAVISSRMVGKTRVVTLNPRYLAYRQLDALLWELGRNDTELQRALAAKRRRPRRAGKPGL